MNIAGVKNETKNNRELRADIDQIIDENEYPEENNIITDRGFRGGVDNWKVVDMRSVSREA